MRSRWATRRSRRRSARASTARPSIGPIHRAAQIGHYTRGAIVLKVNGAVQQNADLNQMIWSVAEQISKRSQAFELRPGDIIFSGTP
jgi:fumarylpyruvate hydrolase